MKLSSVLTYVKASTSLEHSPHKHNVYEAWERIYPMANNDKYYVLATEVDKHPTSGRVENLYLTVVPVTADEARRLQELDSKIKPLQQKIDANKPLTDREEREYSALQGARNDILYGRNRNSYNITVHQQNFGELARDFPAAEFQGWSALKGGSFDSASHVRQYDEKAYQRIAAERARAKPAPPAQAKQQAAQTTVTPTTTPKTPATTAPVAPVQPKPQEIATPEKRKKATVGA